MTYYSQHKEEQLARNRKAVKALKVEIRALKELDPCLDCGQFYPYYVMQYDHRPEESKVCDVSAAMKRGRSAVFDEIAKCDLVCANCHAERTHRRRSGV